MRTQAINTIKPIMHWLKNIIDKRRWAKKIKNADGIGAIYLQRPDADSLIVMLHGWTDNPQTFSELIPPLEETFPAADLFIPEMPLAWASLVDLDRLAERLANVIERLRPNASQQKAEYKRITLMGHSCGGILARQLYLAAYGVGLAPGMVQVPPAPRRAWIGRVDRIVLLAAVNRGWTISSAMSPFLRFVAPLAIGFGHMMNVIPGRTPVAFQIRRGSAQLTNMRLKWMVLERTHAETLPPVVQLLGTIDDIVAPEDNFELLTGARFIYLEAALRTF
jgi:pimeloyl-ACP methyl ester carboxylesterase